MSETRGAVNELFDIYFVAHRFEKAFSQIYTSSQICLWSARLNRTLQGSLLLVQNDFRNFVKFSEDCCSDIQLSASRKCGFLWFPTGCRFSISLTELYIYVANSLAVKIVRTRCAAPWCSRIFKRFFRALKITDKLLRWEPISFKHIRRI